jgi:hypothetical protein
LIGPCRTRNHIGSAILGIIIAVTEHGEFPGWEDGDLRSRRRHPATDPEQRAAPGVVFRWVLVGAVCAMFVITATCGTGPIASASLPVSISRSRPYRGFAFAVVFR